MNGALLRTPWCRACRNNLLQSLAAFSGVPIAPAALPKRTSFPRHSQRSFSIFQPRLSEHTPSGNSNHTGALPADRDSPQQDGNSTATEEHVPWYLQVETPDLPQTPRPARQDLPPLPDNPPPILEDVLNHVSIDIGLDDLVLYDLRKLDPPPALGANLIMIIGTARSVKHLNVSADRLCRWLRSTYKLQPDADGLLGRNELKIKLRRKARRAKLASNAGTTLDNHDDGITTGWICVNAGVVEDKQSDALNKQRNDNFVGFGESVGGTRIVVQMLTEEKRADIDLEGLWANAVDRKTRRDNKISESRADAPLEEVGAAHDIKSVSPSDRDLRATHRLQNRTDQGQKRAMHTCRRLQSPITSSQSDTSNLNSESLQPNAGERVAGRSKTSTTPPTSPSVSTISLLFQFLSDLSEDEALKQLGRGPDDRNSTQFLDIFYKTLSNDDESTFAINKLELIRKAIVFRHPGYTKGSLFDHFYECMISGFDLPEHQMWQIMDTLLLPQPIEPGRDSFMKRVPEPDIDMALQVLDHMSLRGINILSGRTLSSLYRAVSFQVPVCAPGDSEPTTAISSIPTERGELMLVRSLQERLQKMIDAGNVRMEPDDFLNLLQSRFNQKDYEYFRFLWGRIALLGIPRSERLYTLFFKLQAERGNQRECLNILSSWPSMMERENPPVILRGDLAKAVMSCILVADPGIKENVKEHPNGELPSLWSQCLRSLEAEQQQAGKK